MDDLSKAGEHDLKLTAELLNSLEKSNLTLPESAKDWPEQNWFNTTVERANSARGLLMSEIGDALERFSTQMSQIIGGDNLKRAHDAIQTAQENFRRACAEKGIQPEDITRLQGLEEQRQTKLKLVEKRQMELENVTTKADAFSGTLADLHAVWREQFDIRSATAKAMEESVASQTVRVSTDFMADKTSFLAAWLRLAPRDGRGKLAKRWDELGDDLFTSWKTRKTEASPWETMEVARTDVTAIPYLYGEILDDLQPALIRYLDSDDVRPLWESIRISRINDGVDVELLRDDGSPAGSMSGALSEGQRNTVLLNLMLSRGIGPIIIDQPEDELDSSFGNCQPSCRLNTCDYAAILSSNSPSISSSFAAIC